MPRAPGESMSNASLHHTITELDLNVLGSSASLAQAPAWTSSMRRGTARTPARAKARRSPSEQFTRGAHSQNIQAIDPNMDTPRHLAT